MKSKIQNPKPKTMSKSKIQTRALSLGLWICFGLWILSFGFPRTADAVRITKESLDKAVNEIEAAYRGVSDLTADFTQKTFLVVMDKNVTNTGILSWKKPGKFLIEYTGGQQKRYISNNKKIWVYVPGDTQAQVYKISKNTISKEALEFMRGFVGLTKNYRIVGWKKSGSTVNMTLVPTFGGAPYSKLECRFRADRLLDRVKIYNNTGNISTYNFSNIRINTGLADSMFKFKKPKGVKLVTAN